MPTLESELEAERQVAELVGELLALEISKIDAGLHLALESAGRIAGAERTSLLSLAQADDGEPVYYSWCDESAGHDLKAWPGKSRHFEWAERLLSRGESILASRVADLPDEAATERDGLLSRGVRSYLGIPMRFDDRLVGYLGFEYFSAERAWSESQLTRLRLIAQAFSSVLRRKWFEEASVRSAERLRTLAAYAKDVICEFSKDGKLVYVSPGISDMLGYTPGEMMKLNVLDLVHHEDRHIIQAGLSDAVGREESVSSLVRAHHRDGSLRWIETDGRIIETSFGETRMVLVVREVTDGVTKRTELEDRLEVETVIADLSRQFIGRGTDELDEGIQVALRGAASIAKASRSFLVSIPEDNSQMSNTYEWNSGATPILPPAIEPDFSHEFTWMSKQLIEGQIVAVPKAEEIPHEGAAEREVLLERGVKSYLAIPVHSGKKMMGILGFEYGDESHDWNDRELSVLRLVAELFTSALTRKRNDEIRARTQAFLEEQLEGEKRVAEISCEFLDLEPHQIDERIRQKLPVVAELAGAEHVRLMSMRRIGEPGREAYDWWTDEVPESERYTIADGEDSYPFAREILLAGEVHKVATVSALPEDAETERIDMQSRGVKSQLAIPLLSERRFIGVLVMECVTFERDWTPETITLLRLVGEIFVSAMRRKRAARELRESQTQLVQSQKMEAVGTLAGGIAHDFNNQLAVMLGNARYVLENLDPETELSAAMVDIERAAEHCAQLTQGLLAFSRSTPVESSPLDVARLLGEVRDLVAPLLPATITFEFEVAPEVDWVCGDRTQLQQVLINLLVNARDALPKGGRLVLAAGNHELDREEATGLGLDFEGRSVEMIVRDEGLGMSREVASRVFEPFFTTKDIGRGTGLGLATAYGIVRQSGGAISLETAPGEGSTFRIVLAATDREIEDARESIEESGALAGRTVLLVEDERPVRRVIRRSLESRGVTVIEAVDGQEGLRIARDRTRDVDVLVTDLTMPAMTGVDLASILSEEQPDLPILFLSGHSDGMAELVAKGLPCADFLQKPFGEERLMAVLEALMMRRVQG